LVHWWGRVSQPVGSLEVSYHQPVGSLVKSYQYRWAHLPTQQTSITVDRLPTNEYKLPFPFCRKQADVCRIRFPFAANKWKLPFSVSSIFNIGNRKFSFPAQTANRMEDIIYK
jgi:hypothetical protein